MPRPPRTLVQQNTVVRNITVNKTTNNIFVSGPQYQVVSARSARPVQVLKLKRETDPAAIRAAGGRTLARQQGNQLVVLAPEIARSETKAQPKLMTAGPALKIRSSASRSLPK